MYIPSKSRTNFIFISIHIFRLNGNKSPINGFAHVMHFVHKTRAIPHRSAHDAALFGIFTRSSSRTHRSIRQSFLWYFLIFLMSRTVTGRYILKFTKCIGGRNLAEMKKSLKLWRDAHKDQWLLVWNTWTSWRA